MINIDNILDAPDVLERPEVLHTGADWERLYIISSKNPDFTLDDASAVCKIRDMKNNVLCTAMCSISGNQVLVQIGYDTTLTIDERIRKGKYDVFVLKDEKSYKICMGDIEIIHDVSMH